MTTLDILHTLEQVIQSRKGADPASSYVAKLLDRGTQKIAQKVGEEGVEVALAAMTHDKGDLVNESADLLFHLMVLLTDAGLSIDDVANELARREGRSGLDEKASRPDA